MSEPDTQQRPSVSRRELLAATGTVALTTTAGCSSLFNNSLGDCDGPQRNIPALQIGDAESPVKVTGFVDYDCPHCANFALNIFPKIRQQYIHTGKIAYIQSDFPIPVSDWSTPVANAVHSVQDQVGNVAAIEFSRIMFKYGQTENAYSMDFIKKRAKNTKADAKQVRKAAEKKPYCKAIHENKQKGKDMGVSGTPTLFVNDKKLEAPSLDELTTAIDDAL